MYLIGRAFIYLGPITLIAGRCIAGSIGANTELYVASLQQQGVPLESIFGVDNRGVPMVCGASSVVEKSSGPHPMGLLPAGMRSWECIPSVIRNDGVDWFRVEVDVNGPVNSVLWSGIYEYYIVSESGTNALWLRDDGLGGDRVAGDRIYTSERCRYRAEIPIYNWDSNIVWGVYVEHLGSLTVFETNGAANPFLIPPSVAVLDTNVPAVETVMLSSNIQVSAHVINMVTTNREAQRALRLAAGATGLAQSLYKVLPDAFDFIAFFTTDHIESSPYTASPNFVSGIFYPVSADYSGTGYGPFNNTFSYGSSGRLKGVTFFDAMHRGIGNSHNAAHEIMHQWSAYTSLSLGISVSGGHYSPHCGIGSLLGGLWKPVATNSSIIRACWPTYYEAPPLDKYMMGLVSTSAVSPLYVSSNINVIPCDGAVTNLRPLVTISNIVAIHGVRTPGPASSQKKFSIGFTIGSHNRLLNATEMTFFDRMAEHFTKPIPDNYSTPDLTYGWVSIHRYFGEGTSWSSDVLPVFRPVITETQSATNGFHINATGFPGRTYRLMGTTNLSQWAVLATNMASTNGALVFLDSALPRPTARYYRLATP
jgi:hypothetical protein